MADACQKPFDKFAEYVRKVRESQVGIRPCYDKAIDRSSQNHDDAVVPVKDFAALYAKGIPMPDAGDCWLCKLPNHDDTGHLLSHIEEGYAHGTLAVNALRWSGEPEQGIAFYLREQYALKNVVRAVRRYLQFKLGLNY